MKYFVPNAKDSKEAQYILEATKKFVKKMLGWDVTDRKIFRLKYEHDGKKRIAEVGKEEEATNEVVILILESNTYLVCTANRGVLRDIPLLVGKEEVRFIEDFED
ncbi:MAG: hypothetical protein HQ555_07725 [Candidatus Aminicenantes bacterium]|nr:hypothetical protein [Candidatus Aminicenantes bacterium]